MVPEVPAGGTHDTGDEALEEVAKKELTRRSRRNGGVPHICRLLLHGERA
jgi:hypothetical protein